MRDGSSGIVPAADLGGPISASASGGSIGVIVSLPAAGIATGGGSVVLAGLKVCEGGPVIGGAPV